MEHDGLSPYAEAKSLRRRQERRIGARCGSDMDANAEDADDGRDIQADEPGWKAIAHRNAHQAPNVYDRSRKSARCRKIPITFTVLPQA